MVLLRPPVTLGASCGYRNPVVHRRGTVADIHAILTEQGAGNFYPQGELVLHYEGKLANGVPFIGVLAATDPVEALCETPMGVFTVVPHAGGPPASTLSAALANARAVPPVRPSSDLMAETDSWRSTQQDVQSLWDDFEARQQIGQEMEQHEEAMKQDLKGVAGKMGTNAPKGLRAGWARED